MQDANSVRQHQMLATTLQPRVCRLCIHLFLNYFSALVMFMRSVYGVWWLSIKLGALHPQGHMFEPHSGCYVGTLGKSFTRSCLYNVIWRSVWLPGSESAAAAVCGTGI